MQKEDIPNHDDKDGDISDDPYLYSINSELESIDKKNDNSLLLFIMFLVPTAFLYEGSDFKSNWLDALFLMLMFGYIAYMIFRGGKQKQKVAKKYGLVCPKCGYKPKAHKVLSTAMQLHCNNCKAKLIR